MPELDTLPTELFLEIATHLGYLELSRVARCNKLLHRRVEPLIYGNNHNEIMRWACANGNLASIRLAASYGASVSWLEMPKPGRFRGKKGIEQKYSKILLLQLAARKYHVNAYNLLIDLGARIEVADMTSGMLRAMIKTLRRLGNDAPLRRFLHMVLDTQHDLKNSLQLDLILLELVMTKEPPLDLVQLLLDRGANPNQAQYRGSYEKISLLSTAIEANNAPLFKCLLASGADINGPRPIHTRLYGRLPQHIPIFKAAEMIAKNGIGWASLIELCLDNGALIDHQFPIAPPPREWSRYFYATPLLIYLESIETWDEDRDIGPIHGLTYLIARGASITKLSDDLDKRRLGLQWCQETPSAIEILLDKWGLEQLVVPRFFNTVKFLIELGSGIERISQILMKYESTHTSESELQPEILDAWQRFLSLLLDGQRARFTTFLSDIILNRSFAETDFGDVSKATIDYLLAGGADINARVQPSDPDNDTVFFRRCLNLRRTCQLDYPRDTLYYYRNAYRKENDRRLSFFRFLMSRGADPSLGNREGETAVDLFMSDMENFDPRNVDYGSFLGRLINILKGEEV
ncbi:hypothetical protein FQN52_003933 [Onygenales sp. PD_12]|nr:hypothetical protein FQN53_009028 [Emmonsiellopsis sp. PD_33]KAK2792165.1 hypothetical protein FQN52_003933 [Onygenales sp. PD_12]